LSCDYNYIYGDSDRKVKVIVGKIGLDKVTESMKIA
jgi:hypothetical protein